MSRGLGDVYKRQGDDGLHADNDLIINSGVIDITDCYEGLEGLTITVNDGTININASDDGINAAGGTDSSGFGGFGHDAFSADSDANIYINGGTITINADGDGIDSNGYLYVTGGGIYVSGPESSADGALDYNGEATITGGTLIAAGASGMAENFGSDSTQGSILVTFTTQSAGTTISLLDESGSMLLSWQSDKTYSSVVISSPDIVVGNTYTIKAGDYETTVTMDSTIYGSGMGMGGFPGGGGFHDGGFSGNNGNNSGDTNNMGGQRPDRKNENTYEQRPDRENNGTDGQRPDGNNDMTPPDGSSDMMPPDGMTPPDGSSDMMPPTGDGSMTPPVQETGNQGA